MADLASLIVEVEGKGIKETTDRLSKLATEGKEAEQSTKSLKQQTDKLVSQLVLEGKAANKTADEVKILKLQQAGASKAQLQAARTALAYKNRLVQQAQAADQAAREQKQLANSSNVVQGNFRAQRGAMQQVSFQLQDIAVQAQAGTSAFVILGQQGPQLASAFGPGGAVAGALIAFGALVGGSLMAALGGASETMEEMAARANKLAEDLDKLTEAQRRAVVTTLQGQLKEVNEEIEDQKRIIADAEASLNAYATGMETFFDQDEYAEMNFDLANQRNILTELEQQQQKLNDTIAGNKPEVQDMLDNLREEAALAGKVGMARDLALAALQGAKPEQLAEIQRLHTLITQKEDEAKRRKEAADAIDEEREALDKLLAKREQEAAKRLETSLAAADSPIERLERQRDKTIALLEADRLVAKIAAEEKGQDVLAVELQYADAIAAVTQGTEDRILVIKENAARKAAAIQAQADRERIESQRNVTNSLLHFENMLLQGKDETTRAAVQLGINLADAEKRENATKIISDSYSAAMSAYKALAGIPVIGPALGAAAAGTIIAAGATYAAASLSGRATGGQVRGGESYLVGERGPELLTMGTSGRIASNDQLKKAVGGGESIQIVNNVDARGAGPDVDQKIRQAMKQTSEMTTANIQNLMRRRRFP